MHTHPLFKIGLISAVPLVPSGSQALSFVLNDVTPGGMSATALQGFQEAADFWSDRFIDPVTVNLDIRFDGNNIAGNPLGAMTLGSAGSSSQQLTYTQVRGALVLDSTSADDAIAVANLPAGPALSFLTNNATTSAVFLDNDGSPNNTVLDIQTANAKALGLRPANDPANDAGISFNSGFSWDFDPSDGIGAGLYDFVGVSIHEIGHALGFSSGVDVVDATHGAGPSAPVDLNNFRVHRTLDFYRYSAPGVLNYATGGAPYFSIDGGATSITTFSTGRHNGDGQQASHWKDNLGIGILDPTGAPGELLVYTQRDNQAMDVIGWDPNPIPEPSSALLALVALGFTVRRRKR